MAQFFDDAGNVNAFAFSLSSEPVDSLVLPGWALVTKSSGLAVTVQIRASEQISDYNVGVGCVVSELGSLNQNASPSRSVVLPDSYRYADSDDLFDSSQSNAAGE